jgi:hypothetical protein
VSRPGRTYVLHDADLHPFPSTVPGQVGGHRRSKIYGRMSCPTALRAIAAGGYVAHRVFFADEQAAAAAGFRPCAVCMPEAHAKWKAASTTPATPPEHSERRLHPVHPVPS